MAIAKETIGTTLVSNYRRAFYLAVGLRQYLVAKSALQGIDNLVPGAYFTERHSYWFTRALRLLDRLIREKKRPKLPSYKAPRIRKTLLFERNTPEYHNWRLDCLDRDNWRCKDCKTAKKLHIHHIKPYLRYEELRLDVDNGMTLCRDCHIKAHKRIRDAEQTLRRKGSINSFNLSN